MAQYQSQANTARAGVEYALAWIDAHAQALAAEDVPLMESAKRILARDAVANLDLPPFDRAAVMVLRCGPRMQSEQACTIHACCSSCGRRATWRRVARAG